MTSKNDYDAGFTTGAINPKTGKFVSGGARRNVEIAKLGGVSAIKRDEYERGLKDGMSDYIELSTDYIKLIALKALS
jgi:hypothetical protein